MRPSVPSPPQKAGLLGIPFYLYEIFLFKMFFLPTIFEICSNLRNAHKSAQGQVDPEKLALTWVWRVLA